MACYIILAVVQSLPHMPGYIAGTDLHILKNIWFQRPKHHNSASLIYLAVSDFKLPCVIISRTMGDEP